LEDIPGVTIYAEGQFSGSDAGLLLHYTFDDDLGPIALDVSGHDHTGTVNSATWTDSGVDGGAFEFDGSRDAIQANDEGDFDFERTDPFTLSAWVKLQPKTVGDVNHIILSKTGLSPSEWRGYYILALGTESNALGIVLQRSHTVLASVRGDRDIIDGAWHHVVGVNLGTDGSASSLRLYVDGEPEPLTVRRDNLGEDSILTGAPVRVGARNAYPEVGPNGTIDGVRIYSRALSSNEVAELYTVELAGGTNGPPTGVPGVYDFESLTAGSLVRPSQDGWTTVLPSGYGTPHNVLIVEDAGGNQYATGDSQDAMSAYRTNDTSFSFPAIAPGTSKTAMAADVLIGQSVGQYSAIFRLGTDGNDIDEVPAISDEYGPGFGVSKSFSTSLSFILRSRDGDYRTPVTAHHGVRGDWVRLLMVMDLEQSQGSLYYRNVTRGDRAFMPVDGMMDVHLGLDTMAEGSGPWHWDTMLIEMYGTAYSHEGVIDNLEPRAVVPHLGPELHYTFDEDLGAVALDVSGHDHTGAVQNAVWTSAGVDGGAFTFDGSRDFIQAVDKGDFNFERTDPFTLSAWVKLQPKTVGDVNHILLSKTGLSPSEWRGYYILALGAQSDELCIVLQRSSTVWASVSGDRDIIDGAWHHVVGINLGTDGSASSLRLYVDGEPEPLTVRQDNLGANSILTDAPVRVGARNAYPEVGPNGTIDDVRIYSRALSSDEVAELYAAEAPGGEYGGELSRVEASAWDNRVGLRWVAPEDDAFAGVRVQMTTGEPPAGPEDGVTVFEGDRQSTVVAGLTNGILYHFGLFPHDSHGAFSAGVVVSATPWNKTRPVLEWPVIPRATWYQLRMVGREGASVVQWLEQAGPRWRADRDLPPGRNAYLVRGWVPGSGPSHWGRKMLVMVDGRVPSEPPALLAPRGSVGAARPVFMWDWVEDAIWYEIQLRFRLGVHATCWVQDVLAFMPKVPLVDGHGSWRIRACGLDGRGPWSEWLDFETGAGGVLHPGAGSAGVDAIDLSFAEGEDVNKRRIMATAVHPESRQIVLTWDSEPGEVYTVYGCTNLVEDGWTPVGQVVGDGGPLEYECSSANERIMFYRVKLAEEE
ncbi:MAG: LamG domain-containing protein, partial [Lentisphaerae bacterium]|nr:LamG domain-containing protein [Lentisphaerota bacterium]